MQFEQTELTRQVAQIARDFAARAIRPHVMEWDEAQFFPREVFRQLGELGLMGVLVPEDLVLDLLLGQLQEQIWQHLLGQRVIGVLF